MEEYKIIDMIKRDPYYIKQISNPTEEMKLAAVNKNGVVLRHIKSASSTVQWAALKCNVWAIEFIDDPSEDMCIYAVEKAWNTLKFIKVPARKVIIKAIENKGWAIQFIENPDFELQYIAVQKDWDAIQYISYPDLRIQMEAVKSYYGALKFIKEPALEVIRTAVRQNAEAVIFISEIGENLLKILVIDNIDVVKYLRNVDNRLVEDILKQKLAKDDVDDDYVVKVIECNALAIDKIKFIYKYGSIKTKRILVDYKLRF